MLIPLPLPLLLPLGPCRRSWIRQISSILEKYFSQDLAHYENNIFEGGSQLRDCIYVKFELQKSNDPFYDPCIFPVLYEPICNDEINIDPPSMIYRNTRRVVYGFQALRIVIVLHR